MRLIKSFGYAAQGIKHCWKREANFRIHVLAVVIVICLALFFRCSSIEWILLIVNMSLVLAFEMFNSAIEKMCDMVSPFTNPQVKIIKDIAAGAVLLAAIAAAVTGSIIFIPKIIQLL